LYFDNNATIRYSNWTYQFYTVGSTASSLTGNYSLIFYDAHGEDWQTGPIGWNATCSEVTFALESLPNNVIPFNSVLCYKSEEPTAAGSQFYHPQGQSNVAGVDPIVDTNMVVYSKYTIAFPENPGKLEQIRINKYLDGTRPTLFSAEATSTLGWDIYPNGFIGEDVDMVSDRCFGVTVTLGKDGSGSHFLAGLDVQETKAFKRCLGDSNGNEADNIEVYNWDYGNYQNPHLIKLQEATGFVHNFTTQTTQYDGSFATDGTLSDYDSALNVFPKTKLCTSMYGNPQAFGADNFGIGYCSNFKAPGFFAVIYFDTSVSAGNYPFRVLTRAAQDYNYLTQFYVYTTTGYLNLVNSNAGVFTNTQGDIARTHKDISVAAHFNNLIYATNVTGAYAGFMGQMDCETVTPGQYGSNDCLDKDDYVMILANVNSNTKLASHLAANPVYPNLYQVKNIGRVRKQFQNDPNYPNSPESEKVRHQIVLDYSMNTKYVYNGGVVGQGVVAAPDTTAGVYKFYPPTNYPEGGYPYAAQCSNRGICDTSSGLCQCFSGYTNDNCDTINALAQ